MSFPLFFDNEDNEINKVLSLKAFELICDMYRIDNIE